MTQDSTTHILHMAAGQLVKDWGEGHLPHNVILIAEVIFPDGTPGMFSAHTGITPWAAVGMLEAELLRSKQGIMEFLERGNDSEEE